MKVIVPGHKYELLNQAGNRAIETISFINKTHEPEVDGTTSEEVILVLIDRIEFLDKKYPCKENKTVIKSLKAALTALNKRTEDRVNRGVEGKQKE